MGSKERRERLENSAHYTILLISGMSTLASWLVSKNETVLLVDKLNELLGARERLNLVRQKDYAQQWVL